MPERATEGAMSGGDTLTIGVIMAGGSGERFWPLSRARRPKQLLRLASPNETMLEESIRRLGELIPPERILIATSRLLREPIRAALGAMREAGGGASKVLPADNVIAEPCKRNTGGCLAYAAAQILARHPGRDPDTIAMAVVTADHHIDNPAAFRATMAAALDAARAGDALATIGVPPTRPETGYGYIEVAADAPTLPGAEDRPPVYPVARFREKPDRAAAEEYLRTGRFFWNSGMFFWTLGTFMRELEYAHAPLATATRGLAAALGAGDDARVEALFESLEDISIDYALMEKARRVVMARAAFGWDDIGAWDALDRGYPADAAGNVTSGDPVAIDTRRCIVINEAGAVRMAVATIGLEDMIVVATDDAVLVAPKSRAQDVKLAVKELRRRQAGQL
ncbi:MAG: sugar phosphate nucleotidyltransferase [bacterium]|nr:sugar phosphate nucleotidyltransferase [bacterium]